MRPILFTSLVFFFFWGCSNSVENNKTQIQTESIPALAVEIPLQEIEDTIKDNNKNSIVPEHVRDSKSKKREARGKSRTMLK